MAREFKRQLEIPSSVDSKKFQCVWEPTGHLKVTAPLKIPQIFKNDDDSLLNADKKSQRRYFLKVLKVNIHLRFLGNFIAIIRKIRRFTPNYIHIYFSKETWLISHYLKSIKNIYCRNSELELYLNNLSLLKFIFLAETHVFIYSAVKKFRNFFSQVYL